ncbi:DUF4855 domain-containing protein [Sphingobacterium puteale]|uniref:DUF4855 domain-containing protein n=1 Tax=Sphingobacterium puteale TaxID=2420510 RepID=A0A420W473_9SPHI|nr:DUF4855 domain-containing protein [Sphingobacterium puteale]RKO73398.1 DUF4855 domain-containing protein [Sphingobacterium puteale]
MKSVLLGIFGMLSLSLRAQDFMPLVSSKTNYITDLALIYQGGIHRPDWNPEQIAHYVYRKERGKVDFLFDGFLFIEFKDGKGKDYSIGYEKEHTGKKEWAWLLDRNFEKQKAVPALNEVLKDLSKQGIRPTQRRKVVLTLPEPIFGQQDWGELNGRKLSFTNEDDRFDACKWYIDTALAYWKKSQLDQLDFAGFYWVAEQNSDGQHLIPRIAAYIKQKGLKFYWIPYWKAEGHGDWQKVGFDAAYQQPNHFFEENIPDSRLDEACDFAKAHGMGMEMEFDSRVEQTNFEKRLQAYIDAFEKHGVLQHAAMAYYEGGDAMMKLAASADPKNRAIYKKVGDLIVERQKKADEIRKVKPRKTK